MILRITADIVLLIAAATLPWWLVVIAAGILMFYFPNYVEGMLVGLVIDTLYAAPSGVFGGTLFVATLLLVLTYIGMFLLKRELRTNVSQ